MIREGNIISFTWAKPSSSPFFYTNFCLTFRRANSTFRGALPPLIAPSPLAPSLFSTPLLPTERPIMKFFGMECFFLIGGLSSRPFWKRPFWHVGQTKLQPTHLKYHNSHSGIEAYSKHISLAIPNIGIL